MKKLLFLAVAALAMLACTDKNSPDAGVSNNEQWSFKDGVLTISCKGEMKSNFGFDLPYPWSKYQAQVTQVIIKDGVKDIGDNAFYGYTNLASVELSNSVTSIGTASFTSCASLTSITFPNSLIDIGGWAFMRCTALTSVLIPNSVTGIGPESFGWCSKLKSITIPNSVTIISEGAFGYTGLTSIELPNSITSIEDDVFSNCIHLSSLTIGNNVKSIGHFAFWKCTSLTTVTCWSIVPPPMWEDSFRDVDCSKISLYVPQQSVEAYRSANYWKNFNPIVGI